MRPPIDADRLRQLAVDGNSLRLRRWSLAGSGGGSDQAGECRNITGRNFAADGRRSVSRALELARIGSWTGQIGWDFRQAPHLVVWGVLAGCLWAVANTLTIFAIRDVGLSIAFPLWNMNSLIGILWGITLFNELRNAGVRRWLSVLGGAVLMFLGACLLAYASAAQTTPEHASVASRPLWPLEFYGEPCMFLTARRT